MKRFCWHGSYYKYPIPSALPTIDTPLFFVITASTNMSKIYTLPWYPFQSSLKIAPGWSLVMQIVFSFCHSSTPVSLAATDIPPGAVIKGYSARFSRTMWHGHQSCHAGQTKRPLTPRKQQLGIHDLSTLGKLEKSDVMCQVSVFKPD